MRLSTLVEVCLALCSTQGNGATVLSPNVSGSGNGGGPGAFLLSRDVAPSLRYQEVHGQIDFARFGTTPVLITDIAYAPLFGHVIDVNLPSMEIHLSTTTNGPDQLSSVFAENVGANDSVVFAGPLHFYDNGIEEYGIHVPLQQPFFYDPAAGNLLLDIRNYQTVSLPSSPYYALRGEITRGDSVSGAGALDANSPTAAFWGTDGRIVLFTVTPIPEPGTWRLIVAVLAIAGVCRWNVLRERKKGGTAHVLD